MVGETPNIDRIGNEGTIFMDYLTMQSCTSGRNAFFTGMYPLRTGMIPPQLPGSPSYLRPGTPAMAVFLRDLGYTGEFGKNHLGDHTASLPTAHGFHDRNDPKTTNKPFVVCWFLPLVNYHWTLVGNVKRDPFEQTISFSDSKSAMALAGSLASPTTAYLYDWNMLPIRQQLWFKELYTFKQVPPLQAPESYNLNGILEQMEKATGDD
jgi:hypothetical protein